MHPHELEKRFRRAPRLIPSGTKDKDFLFSAPILRAPPSSITIAPYLRLRDQYQEGSCVGNSMCFAVESIRNKFRAVDGDSDCSRDLEYRLAQAKTGNLGTDAGASLRGGLDAGVQYGFGRESLYPYTGVYNGAMPDATALAECAPHKISLYERITIDKTDFNTMAASAVAIKQAMAAGHRVVFGMSVPRGMFKITGPMATHPSQWSQIVGSIDGSTIMGAHAIVSGGYDDTMDFGNGCCVLGNSWGAGWGDNGYTAVPWFTLLGFVFEAWAIHGFDGYTDGPTMPPSYVSPELRATLFSGLAALGLGAPSADGTLWTAPDNQLPAVFEFFRRKGQLNTAQVGTLVGYDQSAVDGWVKANAGVLAAWAQF